MTKYNWNYEELGFESETEMKESIARVERRMKQGDVENEIERLKEAQSTIDTHGNINLEAIRAGARQEELDRVVYNQILHEKEQAKIRAEQEDIQDVMSGLSEHLKKEKQEQAKREYEKQKAKADAELQKEIFEKHGVKTDKQQALDDAYSKLLNNKER